MKKGKPRPGRRAAIPKAANLADRRLAAEHATSDILAEAATLSDAVPKILPNVCEALDWVF